MPTWKQTASGPARAHGLSILADGAVRFGGELLRMMRKQWKASPTWNCCECDLEVDLEDHVLVMESNDDHVVCRGYHRACVAVVPVRAQA